MMHTYPHKYIHACTFKDMTKVSVNDAYISTYIHIHIPACIHTQFKDTTDVWVNDAYMSTYIHTYIHSSRT